ncbi:MAG: alpha-amylase, partial [Sphingobacteriales bacterium]
MVIPVLGQGSLIVYPTHWWVGMKNPALQVMLHGKDISASNVSLAYPGVRVQKITKADNPNYLFVDLLISPAARPGVIDIKLTADGKSRRVAFNLRSRRAGKGNSYAQGVTSKDFMYLVMPDRFSNGDESNDRVAGMRDQTLNRDTVFNRHGGDLKGIQNHLDYFTDLGVTTLWLNPVIENDMPNRTEHGYAFTDHYKVDARLGGDIAYKTLI